MSLAAGTRLGPYEIEASVGAGGMGEVYKARDTRLDRTVAIKVLPAHVADDPNLRQRFEREARTISQLNHPHICTLHDVGRDQGIDFLVMEHLEGQTLAHRLQKGPLPFDQAVQYAIQMADALDAAHRQGIVHRDLKPGNVMLVKGGTARQGSSQVKLLDFGLAKLRPAGTIGGLSAAPTRSSPLTGEGNIVGTVQYMAPEQIEGEEADARTDIFAFGLVLYEMVSGRKPFTGKTTAGVMGAILKEDPPALTTGDPTVPAALDRVIRRSLAKNPDDRWQSARDLALELASVAAAGPELAPMTTPPAMRRFVERLAWAAGGVTISATVATGWLLAKPAAPPPRVSRLLLPVAPAEGLLTLGGTSRVAISRDGRRVAFAALASGRTQLFVRSVDQDEAVALAGTDGANTPVFSPNGEWIAYFATTKLLKVAVTGGASLTLCEVGPGGGRGAKWGPDDWIVYATGQNSGIMRVRSDGGEPERLTTVDPKKGEFGHAWPDVVAGGRAVIFSVSQASGGQWDDANIELLDLETRARRTLVRGGGGARVMGSGHLVLGRAGSLLAAPFDLERLLVTGPPVPLQEDVDSYPVTGASQWALAENGTLIYLKGVGGVAGSNLHWADGRGSSPASPIQRAYADPRLSADGRFLAVEVMTDGDEIWVLDLERGTPTRMTFDPNEDETPTWSPDGRWIAWSGSRAGQPRIIFRKRADGGGTEEKLWSAPEHMHVASWSPDGRALLLDKDSPKTSSDVWLLPLDGTGSARPLVQTPFQELGARVSPDGRWIAYTSNEAGRDEVYVQPFPALGAKWQVSTAGGGQPVWSRDGRRLFYVREATVMAVDVSSGVTFSAGVPQKLFEDIFATKGSTHTGYDISPDGRRFIFARVDNLESRPTSLHIVENWLTEVAQRVPTK